MTSRPERRLVLTALIGGTLALAGCGRRGALEPVPGSAQDIEWQRRRQAQAGRPAGSVQTAVDDDRQARSGIDLEQDLERGRTDTDFERPSDPTAPVATGNPFQTGRRRPPPVVPPKQPFILDPLLE
jgi:hypothetical protein